MPNRPPSHWLEDRSKRAFAEALEPRMRFYERPQPEYGIDGDVEEFDSAGDATGLHFFAQLKATEQEDLGSALAVEAPLGTADYYRATRLPVVMVRYHAPTQQLYARWFHQYDPYYGRGARKTLTFRWEPTDAWEADTPGRLAADAHAFFDLRQVSLSLPRPLHVVTSGAFGLEPAEISIALRAAAAERSDVIVFNGGPPPAGSLWASISGTEFIVNLAKVTTATLHIPGDYTVPAQMLAADTLGSGRPDRVGRHASNWASRTARP